MSLPHAPSKHQHLFDFLSHCHKRRYPARSTLIYAGEESDTLFYLMKGSVTVIIEDSDGREMIMAYLNEGDFLARWACLTISNHPAPPG